MAATVHGQSPVPPSITYQGRVSVNGMAFTGMGSFKFALVKQTAPPPTAMYESLWSNDGTSVNGSEPTAAVEGIAIQGGQYSVALGDTSLSGMSLALSATLFAGHEGLKLRVWFNDGPNGFQQLVPDVALGAVPYAQVAGVGLAVQGRVVATTNLEDGAVTAQKIGSAAVTADKIEDSAVGSSKVADGSLQAADLSPALQADSLIPTGTVVPFAGSVAPTGWAMCDGTSKSRNDPQYSRLFGVITTTYGSVNGNEFTLPDLRGRVVAGRDNMGGTAAGRITNSGAGNPNIAGTTLGATGGVDRYKLLESQLAPHVHGPGTYSISGGAHSHRIYVWNTTTGGAFTLLRKSVVQNHGGTAALNAELLNSHTDGPAHTHPSNEWSGASATNRADNEHHPIVQPTMILNYIIKL